MADVETLSSNINERLAQFIQRSTLACGELTLEIAPENLLKVCLILRDDPEFDFKMLLDVCGVDYLHYGLGEWETESATTHGFERGVDMSHIDNPRPLATPRFAAVYHLLSLNQNHRIRLRTFLDDHHPKVVSVISIWPSANWYEREAFDLFGIEFTGHPDLRRLLTDYGFIGHPFRKDFPLIGNVEVRYDAKLRRVIYEPVSIKPRILEPKVIRRDNRYKASE
jgi:NADH-quinone oxidoreductase subunit C